MMSVNSQETKANQLLFLHKNGNLLILPNIWNPIGARVLEAKGYPAIATASAAISSSLGYVDGERIKFSTLVYILSRIVKSVNVPVTADMEAGYAKSIEELKENTHRILATGVAGINIEDSIIEGGELRTIKQQMARIAAVRDAAQQRGIHLVINARIDSFLTKTIKSQDDKIKDAIKRAKAYVDAGADCVYPIGPGDEITLNILRREIKSPLNVLASADAISLKRLQEMGINRVSIGPFLFRACLKKIIDAAETLKNFGSYDCFAGNTISVADASKFLIDENEV